MTARTLGQWERTVHHAEGVGRVAEVREVAGEDRAVGLAEHGAEPLDGSEGHVDVAEADESHRRGFSCRPTPSQRGRAPSG